jgi:hypothetical protein
MGVNSAIQVYLDPIKCPLCNFSTYYMIEGNCLDCFKYRISEFQRFMIRRKWLKTLTIDIKKADKNK